ncbi:unnamed protein product [Cercospora beticola]|nr:unnamed protein product [Cercospora beticola]
MGAGRSQPVALNISWLLVDMTEKNGGTRIFPGSHLVNVRPRNIFSTEGSIAAEAPAGTALCFEGRLWHGTGPNNETSGERPVILSLFCNKGIRPKENALLGLDHETEAKLSERDKSLTGFRTSTAGIGGTSGESRAGITLARPRDGDFKQTGKLRAPHDDAEVARMIADGTHATNAASQARAVFNVDG